MSSTYSAGSAASPSGSSVPGCASWHCASPQANPAPCSPATGPASPATPTSGGCPPPSWTRTGCRDPTCCAAASPARTSAQPGAAPGCSANAAACGTKCCGWCESCDPVGWWLRTSLRCAFAERTGYWQTWQRKATPAGRSWWVLPMPARPTGGSGRSFWPTPTARDWKSGSAGQRGRRRACPLPDAVGGRLNPDWVEWLLGFPVGWTAPAPAGFAGSATPSCQTLPPRSVNQS